MGCANAKGVACMDQAELLPVQDFPMLLRTTSGETDSASKSAGKSSLERQHQPSGEQPLLHELAAAGDTQKLRECLVHGVEVDVRTKIGQFTPLHLAATCGQVEAAQVLLAAGADVHAKDQRALTPLMHAVENGHEEAASLLLAAGAQVNVRDVIDSTVLHYCAQHSRTRLAKILVAVGADLHAKNANGYTPYAMAQDWGSAEISNFFLEQGGFR